MKTNRLMRLENKGYKVQFLLSGKVICSKGQFSEIYNSVSDAHKRLLGY